MNEGPEGDGTGNRSGATTGRLPDQCFEAVRPGDTVVHTTALGQEYEYTVATVDPPWLTFETGQQVHRRRFEREDFAVVPATGGGAATPTALTGDDDGDTEEESLEAAAPATDGGDLRPPNAD